MIQNNITALAWYTDKRYQDFRKSYAYGKSVPLLCPIGYVLPFQFLRKHQDDVEILKVELYNCNDSLIKDITQDMQDAGLKIIEYTEYDIFFFSGVFSLGTVIQPGTYYLRIQDTTRSYYSELITFTNIDTCLKVEWWDEENFKYDSGMIEYSSQYHNIVYIDTELGKPSYPYEEEGESRDGVFFAEKQISKKTYAFKFLAPEYLCDAMTLIRLSQNIVVTNKGVEYRCDELRIDPKWTEKANIASVEVEIDTNTIFKRLGRGYLPKVKMGDFNNDFDNDFDK